MYFFEPIRDEHLPFIAEILNYYIINTIVTFHKNTLSAEDMREKVFFSQPFYRSYIIKEESENSIIGYCAYTPWKKQEAYRHTAEINIYIKPDYTGKDIGSKAIAFLENESKENEIKNLISGVCTDNLPSIKLFQKNGYKQCAYFSKVGEKFGRTLDMVYFQKLLDK